MNGFYMCLDHVWNFLEHMIFFEVSKVYISSLGLVKLYVTRVEQIRY